MSIPRSWWYTACLGFVAAALLPWVARHLRGNDEGRCALDGAGIAAANAVWIRSQQHGESTFCSLHCAEQWLQRSGVQPQAIRVTNEATGRRLDAGHAYYVRSQVVVHPATRERRHVFGSEAAARRHAEDHFGRILEGDERPFTRWTASLPQAHGEPASTVEINPGQGSINRIQVRKD